MFKIGMFSKLSNITVKMLRHYDEIDLLKPDTIDPSNEYRYYTAKQLVVAAKINRYKSLGFSLKNIKFLLENETDETFISTHLHLRKIEIEETQQKLNEQLAVLTTLMNEENKMKTKQYAVVKKEIPARNVASLRKTIPSYHDEAHLWNDLDMYLQNNAISPIYDGYTMAIYHDAEYKPENVDIELQITVPRPFVGTEGISFVKTESWNVLSVTFAGSYEQMPFVTESIASYAEHNHLTLSSEMVTIFHVSPAQTCVENEYVTEACYLLEKTK